MLDEREARYFHSLVHQVHFDIEYVSKIKLEEESFPEINLSVSSFKLQNLHCDFNTLTVFTCQTRKHAQQGDQLAHKGNMPL